MPDEPADTSARKGSPLVILALLALAIPIAYVLSVGPVQWLGAHGYIPVEANPYIFAFYWPLTVLEKNCHAFSVAFNWYSDLSIWEP